MGRRTCGWGWALFTSVFGVFLISVQHAESSAKLNVPRVRLPYFETLSVNFTLSVDTTPACYTWSVSRSDVVIIHLNDPETLPDGTQCSQSAVISTIPRVAPCCPATAIVHAEDVRTKEMLRCDVIIDKITAIQIMTITKELHLEEAPSKFHILGFGSKDNELSTLDGVPFTWLLESPKQTSTHIDPQSIMRFMPFSESLYEAPKGVSTLEEKRMQGDTVLVEGIKTGSAEVIARIADPYYKDLEARVRIVVVASLYLEPSEAFIPPGTVVPLKLFQMKHGKKFEIPLPSSVYEFKVENKSVVTYDDQKSEVTSLDFGDTTISVTDKNCLDELEEQPEALTARFYVREPKYLSMTVFPYKNWALIMGEPYEIQVDVFDEKNQKLIIGDNVFVETTFDPVYFRVDNSSANGTYHVGVPIRQGSAYVKAVLKKVVLADGTEMNPTSPPRVKTEMEIFQNIGLNPKETILPWDPNVMPKYELRWNPSGGNGNFLWSSTNTSVLTVSQKATGKTVWFGSANVTAASSVNPHINGVARVHILPPIRMAIVEHIVEAEVGTAIQVPLAFYTIRPNDPNRTEVPYSSCKELPFNVHVQDSPNFLYDEKTHYPNLKPACVVLPIMGNALGSSRVTVTYDLGENHYEDSVTVSTFKPLETIVPTNEIIVLALGSSKQVVFEGGPRPLLEKSSGFSKVLEIKNTTVASQTPVKIASGLRDDIYVYEVLCREIGETEAVFSIGNAKVTSQTQSIIRIKVVKVVCSEPSAMYFKVETPIKTKCPNDGSAAQAVRVAVPNYEHTQISVFAKDRQGRKFDNVTSLLIEWTSTPAYLDFATPMYAPTEPINNALGYVDTGKGIQMILPNGKSGNVEVFGKITGYRNEVLKHYGIKHRELAVARGGDDEDPDFPEHSMDLQLVSDVSLDPSATVSLFNHPSTKKLIKIKDGSGYFEYDLQGAGVVNVSYDQMSHTLEISPKQQGNAKIVLIDLCVSSRKKAVIDIDVTGIGRIDVEVEEKMPLKGEQTLSVSLHDHNGKLLPHDIVTLADLALVPLASDILKVTPLESTKQDSKLHFKVVGHQVGSTEVVFGAKDGIDGGVIQSSPKVISVFPPLVMRPKTVTLLVGNKILIDAKGGPSDADIVFKSETQDIAWVAASAGEVEAKTIGKSLIRGYAVDAKNPNKIYSEDYVEVKVVTLTALLIKSPLEYIFENEKLPIWISGMADKTEISPGSLAQAKPTLNSIEWIVSNKESAEIIRVFKERDMYDIGKYLRVQFFAKRAGNITIQVRANYNKKKIISPKLIMEIKAYPFGVSNNDPEVEQPSHMWNFVIAMWSTAYYWLVLPLLLAVSMAIASIAYNGYLYGQQGKGGAKVDTTLFMTQPPSPPHSYSPSLTRGSPGSYASSPGGSGDGLFRRLYSVPDSELSGRYSASPASHRY